jgi:hypothetical protein
VDHTVVKVVNQDETVSFQKMIHPAYYRHLIRYQEESVGASERCRWLWKVLDRFAEELQKLPDTVEDSWRSYTLNPLLTRAFHALSDHDQTGIEKCMFSITNKTMKASKKFYLELDILTHVERWNGLFPEEARPEDSHQAKGSQVNTKCDRSPGMGNPGEPYRNALTISRFTLNSRPKKKAAAQPKTSGPSSFPTR